MPKLPRKAPRKARPTGDKATNARKRFYRSAERYMKKAENASGATAARYKQLARNELDNALSTYSQKTTQKFSQPIQRLANQLGVSLEEERNKIKSRTNEFAEKIRNIAISDKEDSKSARRLVSAQQDEEQLRQTEARAILNSPIGSRILGGLVDIWQDKATVTDSSGRMVVDQRKILPALFDHFNVDNLADMLEKVEEVTGTDLYAAGDEETMYESVKLMLQKHVKRSNSVTR